MAARSQHCCDWDTKWPAGWWDTRVAPSDQHQSGGVAAEIIPQNRKLAFNWLFSDINMGQSTDSSCTQILNLWSFSITYGWRCFRKRETLKRKIPKRGYPKREILERGFPKREILERGFPKREMWKLAKWNVFHEAYSWPASRREACLYWEPFQFCKHC